MKTSLSFVFMVCYFNFLAYGNDNDHKALIFNLKRNPSLISISGKGSPQVKCNTWATACPATVEYEKEFNEKYALYDSALFVKNHHRDEEDCTDIQKATCKEPYKTSMAWFKDTIEFGYEVYFEYDKSVYPNFNIKYAANYDDYEPLKAFLKLVPLSLVDVDVDQLLISIKAARSERGKKTKLMLNGRKMEFIWIPLFRVWFNAYRLRKIEYQIRENNTSSALKCKDYSLGKELFRDVDVDKLYSEEHQERRLEGLNVTPESEEHGCEDGYKCLTKWLLIPSDQFQLETDANSTPKCSNIATIPIWKSTLEGILKKLDMYLYTLSRVSGEPLRIITGVSEILQLPRSRYFVLNTYVSLVDEKTNFSIRVPKIIYKIVKMRTNKCPWDHDDDTCWYGVLIVIHNDPHYDGEKTICKDVTQDWGWWAIKFKALDLASGEETPSKFIYACKLNIESIEAVGLTYRNFMIIHDFSLKRFPVYKGEELIYTEMDKKVNAELERMKKSGESIEIKNDVIERPPIYDEDFGFDVQNDSDDTDLENEISDGEAESSSDDEWKKIQ